MKLLLRFMKPYRALVAVTLLVLLVDNVGTLLVPTMLADMINIGIGTGDFDYIVHGGLAMLGASLLASGGAMTGAYLAARLAACVARDIRNAVYDASLSFSGGDFERFGTGSMITRTLNDSNVIQQSIIATIQLVLPVPFLSVAGIVMACMIDYQMGLLLACVVAIVLAIAVVTVAKAAPIFMSLQKLIDRMNIVLRESIVGARVIRAFNKERHAERRLDEVFTNYADRAIKVNLLFAGLDCSAFFFMNIAEVAVLWLGGNRVGAHAMQIASITAVLEYAMLILFFVMMAQIVALTLPRAKACLDRAAAVIDLEPEIVDGDASAASRPAATDGPDDVAVFDHASFRFADADEDTLHDLSFSCKRGQTTAIIGSTGSGKSTIAKMLLRLHDVTGGAVRFCGTDVRDMAQRDLRGAILLRSPEGVAVLRYGREQPCLWRRIGRRGAHALCARGRAERVRARLAEGPRVAGGPGRHQLLRWPAPAPLDRPRPYEARGPVHLRRQLLGARFQDGCRAAPRAGARDARCRGAHHRAAHQHHPPCRTRSSC